MPEEPQAQKSENDAEATDFGDSVTGFINRTIDKHPDIENIAVVINWKSKSHMPKCVIEGNRDSSSVQSTVLLSDLMLLSASTLMKQLISRVIQTKVREERK